MQKANGLNLKMCGASYNSLMSGMVMGYSCHPKTLRNYEKSLAEANKQETKKRILEAVTVRILISVNHYDSLVSLFESITELMQM